MKNKKKIFAFLTVLVLSLSVMAMPAFAATTVNGTAETEFDKYLTMDKNANVPNATFNFAITSGDPVTAVTTGEKKTPAVMAGPAGAKLTYNTTNAANVDVVFAPSDTTYSSVQTGDSVTLGTDKKYAKKSLKVDLTGVTFTEPGIYRYKITETGTNAGISNDATTTRYLDVYIDSDANGDLSVQGYVLHKTTDVLGAEGGNYGDSKDKGFQNDYTTNDLTISKTVDGNQAFRGKYFKFEVLIQGAVANTVYTVDLSKATTGTIAEGKSNPTTLTTDGGGMVTATFYLKHGESITIQGLTSATQCYVTEDPEDYTQSLTIDGRDIPDPAGPRDGLEMNESDHTFAFKNYRNGVVPTGILLDIAPYALVILLAGAAAVLMITRKRRSTAR